MKIYLDDERPTPPGYVGARNFSELRALLAETPPERIKEISFDNDLGEGEKEGYEIMKWIGEHHPDYLVSGTDIKIHSANPKGRENMEEYLRWARANKQELLEMQDRPHPFGEIKRR